VGARPGGSDLEGDGSARVGAGGWVPDER